MGQEGFVCAYSPYIAQYAIATEDGDLKFEEHRGDAVQSLRK